MGRQVNFFLHPDDQQEFDTFLKTFDDLILISYYHHSDKLNLISDTIVRDFISEGTRVYLARQSDLSKITLNYIAPQKYWLVNSHSPTLDFDRSIFRENTIQSGRLYFQPKFVKDMQWVDQPADFVKWSDNIIKAARKKLKKYKYDLGNYSYTALLGTNALDWMNTNNADIQGGGHILAPSVAK